MKAAVLETLNAPLRIADVGLLPLQFGQVLVRVLVSGICGAQLQEISGHKGNAGFLPHLLGHEGCGLVEEVGPGVLHVNCGDKVVMHWRKGAGIESDFPAYVLDGQTIRSGKVTTFSEYSVVSENRLTRVPAGTPPDLAALLGCGLSTALGTIENEAAVRFGESVLVVGVGGVGANMIRAAALAHAWPIGAVDVHSLKRSLAREMGAHFFFNPIEVDLADAVRAENIRGFDVIIDTAGTGASMESALPLLNPGGRFIMLGQPIPGRAVSISEAKHMFEGEGKVIKATQGGGFHPEFDIPRYVRLHAMGALKIEDIVSERIPLCEINHGLDLVREGQASRVMVDMTI